MTIIRSNFEKFLATIIAISLLLTLIPIAALDVKAQEGAAFIFVVEDEQGESVEDAVISIAFDDEDILTALTDDNGIAEFEGLMPDTEYLFTVQKEGYDEFSDTILTDEEGAGNYAVVLNTAPPTSFTIAGTITFEGGAITGAEVTLVGEEDITTLSDENGEFTFTGLEDGDYTIIVVASGYKVLEKEVSSAQ